MTLSDTALDVLLKRLHLANARRVWRDLTLRAEHEQWSCRDFLTLLISEEIAHRQQTRLGRVSRWARFPFLKTIDDFDFTYQSVVRLSLLGSALASDFVTEGRSLILSGKPGRGKTHLAIAIAYRAIQNGFDARFVTAAELIDDLSAAFRAGRLADALITYTHPAVLVVDEVGYLTYGTDAANMLFHVVNDRHRHKRSMIFTTNKSLTAWGHVLHDDDLAHAIIDRVLERGRLLPLDGPSMRTKHLGLDDPTSPEASHQLARSLEGEVIRISGIEAPQFPEPTLPTVATLFGVAGVGVVVEYCRQYSRFAKNDPDRLQSEHFRYEMKKMHMVAAKELPYPIPVESLFLPEATSNPAHPLPEISDSAAFDNAGDREREK